MSNIDKQALRTDLLMANALETAKQLRELQESSVAEAIFESIIENENGKEIQFERPISDLVFAAFWQMEKLVEALEAAERQIAELEAREVTLPQVLDVHPLGPQSAKMFWVFKRDVVNECADRIRAAGIRINGEG